MHPPARPLSFVVLRLLWLLRIVVVEVGVEGVEEKKKRKEEVVLCCFVVLWFVFCGVVYTGLVV